MAEFDNLEDVNQKFANTIVLYAGKAALVKATDKLPADFILHLQLPNARAYLPVLLKDPALNYKNFQLGYANSGGYTAWWYRKPQKQWSQGLRGNQLGCKVSTPGVPPHDNFGFTKPFILMLENIYPSVEDTKKALIDGNVSSMAWHRDFALSYDPIHEDCILEYRGMKIGHAVNPQMDRFKILPEARHLQEALEEARQNVHP